MTSTAFSFPKDEEQHACHVSRSKTRPTPGLLHLFEYRLCRLYSRQDAFFFDT